MTRNQPRRRWAWRTDTPRVLLECAAHDSPEIVADAIRREGYEVAVCTGPDPSHPCDLLHHGACELVDHADVVVNLLHSRTGDEVGTHVASMRRPPAMVKQTAPASSSRPGTVPDSRVVTVDPRVSRTRLVAAIREALRRHGPPPIWGDGNP
ncbi:MAG: hypothetical protein U0Q22_18980 [Acidimicrobiales bacterium]